MARTAIPVVRVTRFAAVVSTTGATAADVANGNVCANDGATMLRISNTDAGGAHTVTVQVPTNVDGTQTVAARSYPVAASTSELTGTFPIEYYSNQLQINADSALILITPFSFIGP